MLNQLVQADTHQRIQEQLKAYIADVGLRPGDRLPSEHQLVKALGVSRNTLREGLRSLEALGILEAKHGKGRYLRNFDFGVLTDNLAYSLVLNKTSMRELLEVRRVLEVGFLPQVIASLEEQDLKCLKKIVKGMRSKTKGGETYSADEVLFHRTLFCRVENELLHKLLSIFWKLLQHISTIGALPPAQSSKTVDYHALIVASVEAGDVREAQRLLDEHFNDLAYRIQKTEPLAS